MEDTGSQRLNNSLTRGHSAWDSGLLPCSLLTVLGPGLGNGWSTEAPSATVSRASWAKGKSGTGQGRAEGRKLTGREFCPHEE